MILNIRGTSGSGKSTIVREIMDLYPGNRLRVKRSPSPKTGRQSKNPLCYVLHRHEPHGRPLVVVGHYESACGGCDTIPDMDHIFSIVREAHLSSKDVLFEGLLISAEFNRTYALHTDRMPLMVIGLSTPLEECLASVERRRANKHSYQVDKALARGKEPPPPPGSSTHATLRPSGRAPAAR